MTAPVTPVDRAADPATRRLLLCGVVAGPVFVVASFVGAFTRAGFDLRRHPFSMLSLGDLGWVQSSSSSSRVCCSSSARWGCDGRFVIAAEEPGLRP